MAARTRDAVKAMTAFASGLRLSSGAHDADIQGMRAAILLAALALPAAASASNTSRIGVSAVVVPSVRVSQEVGVPVKTVATAGGAFYVLPMKGSARAYGGVAPSISVEGAEVSLRRSSATAASSSVEGDLRVFVPEGSGGRVVVTVLADGAPAELRKRR